MSEGLSRRITYALRRELERGCAEGVFPGASASVATYGGGRWGYVDACAGIRAQGLDEVRPDTFYDLASLTKPFVAMTALKLYQAGRFPLDSTVRQLFDAAEGLSVGRQTWDGVLSHRSGLAAWEAFYERIPNSPGSNVTRTWLLGDLLSRWNEEQVGKAVYSDLGYILAGEAMARATGEPLELLVEQRVTLPLGIADAVFFAAAKRETGWTERCAPTGWSAWRERVLLGEVHDDNCAALGGIAGHAGMFGTAHGVAAFGAACVGAWHGRAGALDEEAIRFATAERPGGSHRLGWDGKSQAGSAAGSSMDTTSFGHLGFTGTSIWCDPRRQMVVVLLTNRVAVSDDNAAIRAFRPVFHDAMVDAFDAT